ncbi:B- and T-lymphocyte attenuator-like [Plectropomus leopardus]|uniref:B- and T-lymphocyte attenuator-like n=1 Tax=Plectropomus leopardus TaxID=160734 RepID=UPI001C4B0BFF|nr:B- and T-lymphocyte attenuator-like [Plectropomus leopardus]
MRPNYRLDILHVSILAALSLTLDANSGYSDCDVEIKVPRDTVYRAVPGENLRINCTVAFCDKPPPTVTWYKSETTDVPVNVSSHIKTEWKLLNPSEGIFVLIFQEILRDDSGVYWCYSDGSVSHSINVFVRGDELTTVIRTTSKPERLDTFWPFVYRVVGIVVFVIVVLTIYVVSTCGCKGESRDAPHPGPQPSHDASPTNHIYD